MLSIPIYSFIIAVISISTILAEEYIFPVASDNSYTFNNDVNISHKRNDDTYKKMAVTLANQMHEDGVI